MKIRLHLPMCLFVVLFYCTSMDAQTLRAYESKAEAAYLVRDYTAALAYNRLLLEIAPDRVDAMFYAGESARLIRAYGIAETHFERIPDSSKIGFYETTDFRIANVKKGLEKYDEAIVFYQKFIESNADSSNLFVQRAQRELEYCEWALETISDSTEVIITQLDTVNVNTFCVDFAPVMQEGVLYYSSGDFCGQSDNPSAKIFSWWGKNKRIQEINFDPQTDSLKHVSNLAFNSTGDRAFFTLCQDDDNYIGEYRCEIFFVTLDDKGNVSSETQKLPPNINRAGYTTTQPTIGIDIETGKEILFYVSDRLGGKGNLDIWYAGIEQGDMFYQPYNLEALNTPEDDVTPFYHLPSNTLFFSSEGYQSLGGLDIFKTKKEAGNWSAPTNVGYPINSSYDDLYYTFNSEEGKAFFASNREGSMCDAPDEGCTCTDIYEAEILLKLKILTFNPRSGKSLEGVKIRLLDVETGELIDVEENQANNAFTFPVQFEKDYKVIATKGNYTFDETEFSTKGLTESTAFNKELNLVPEIYLIAKAYDAISKEPLNGTWIQLINDESKKDSVVLLPLFSNECRFPLDFNQGYEVAGAKNGFLSARDTFDTFSFTEPTFLKQDLFLTPFKLPITLFFDNDKPRYDRKNDTTTEFTYQETYENYMNRQEVFSEEYTGLLIDDAKLIAQKELDDFFIKDVKKGWDEFETFCAILIPYLESGNSIDIIVEGYASPLAPPEYNRLLTSRRISSVINQLRIYEDGILAPYLKEGKLVLREEPNGEDKANKLVSDSEQDRRASVFSPEASRERRVRIIDVRKQDNKLSWVEMNKEKNTEKASWNLILTRKKSK